MWTNPGSYELNDGDSTQDAVALNAWCMTDSGVVDPYSLVGDIFSCTGAKQTYTAAVDGTVTVWMSGAGGGFGTLAHPPNTGGAAGVSYGSWSLKAGDSMDVYVGCKVRYL